MSYCQAEHRRQSLKSSYSPTELWTTVCLGLSSYFTRVADVPSRTLPKSLRTSNLRSTSLRSSTSEQLIVQSFNLTTVGRRAFPVSAANLLNSLPAHLTSHLMTAPSLTILRQRLRTFLFHRSYPDLIFWHSELTTTVDLAVTALFRPLDNDDDVPYSAWACRYVTRNSAVRSYSHIVSLYAVCSSCIALHPITITITIFV